ETITYQVFQPLFERECGICHGQDPSKGLSLVVYARLMAGSTEGPVVVPGEPENSALIAVLEAGHFGKFSTAQIALLKQWIAEGALEETPSVPEGEIAEPDAEDIADADAEDAEDTGATTDADAVSYADLEPILTATCGGCHGEGVMIGLSVTTYDTLMAGGDNGPVVEPGEPENSTIIAVQEAGHYGQLDEEQIALLEQWIADGALEEAASAPEE
ncbi:MAG: hypothetical protein K8S97_12885, partial [Anaerolineae bacterium]|nr:hypothetical protein [Anaerolineae bacterium]